MRSVHYEITEETVSVEEKAVTTYGVRMRTEDGWVEIADVSGDRAFVEELVRSFNENGLEPAHFRDAVEDLIVTD